MAELEIKPTVGMRFRVAAVIAVGGLISLVLIYLLTGGGGEVLAERANLITYMPNSFGLNPKSPVRLNGILVGRVRSVAVSPSSDPERAVHVVLDIKRSFLKIIPTDSETSVRADNLVGDKFVQITAGRASGSVTEGNELRSEPVRQAADNADLIATLQRNLNAVNLILQQVSSPDSQLGQLILRDTYYTTLLARVVDFNRGVHALLTPRSAAGKAFFTMEAYQRMRDPIARVDAQLAAIQRGEGQGGRLFASDDQYNNTLKMLRDLRAALADANAGKGQLGRSLTTEDDYRRVQELLRSTDAMISSLNVGEGQLGQLLTSAQLYESLSGSLRGLQMMLADIQANPRKYLRTKVF